MAIDHRSICRGLGLGLWAVWKKTIGYIKGQAPKRDANVGF